MSSWPLRGFRVVSIVNTIKRKKKLGNGFMFGIGKFIEINFQHSEVGNVAQRVNLLVNYSKSENYYYIQIMVDNKLCSW